MVELTDDYRFWQKTGNGNSRQDGCEVGMGRMGISSFREVDKAGLGARRNCITSVCLQSAFKQNKNVAKLDSEDRQTGTHFFVYTDPPLTTSSLYV